MRIDHAVQESEMTVRFTPWSEDRPVTGPGMMLTVFDAQKPPYQLKLSSFEKDIVFFGRSMENDIVLSSNIVSRHHGQLTFDGNCWHMEDCNSRNGIVYQNARIASHVVETDSIYRIDAIGETISDGVLMLFSSEESNEEWKNVSIDQDVISIGRDPSNVIVLPHSSVSKHHARIIRKGNAFFLEDLNSTNGVIVNNSRLNGQVPLHEKDVITITNSTLIFTSTLISYCCRHNGISVDVSDVVIRRKNGRKSFITSDHVSLHVNPGELVAIIGGSGAGKSTILNAMCGYLKPSEGRVHINGSDLYRNFDSLKMIIGYVPQSDIVYDNLTLHDMLLYTAKLRLPADISPAEREEAISRAIDMVELTEKRNSYIKALSGGQRKRASIAVELLSDPNLLFLDEPASGLDPGTERNLMRSLRGMANNGKTVILVTHSTLQLQMCDKVVFMGKGGKLCYCGPLQDALGFFGVNDVVDIYAMITDHADEWATRYSEKNAPLGILREQGASKTGKQTDRLRQLGVLCQRYIKLVIHDRQRLLLLMAQAPILALLISFVANGDQFKRFEMTESLLFALSCSAFWVGMLNAIQEICKERVILKREFMTGLSLTSYILSKILVLGLLCLIQSLLLTTAFALLIGVPEEGILTNPYLEFLITSFLTALSSASMGLLVSSLFTNADRAMTVAPILLMPQILFSGLLFKLEGATEIISWFAVCRWSMEGYGTSANLNALPNKLDALNIPGLERKAEAFFEYTKGHMVRSWAILIAFTIGFLVLARLSLAGIGQEESLLRHVKNRLLSKARSTGNDA